MLHKCKPGVAENVKSATELFARVKIITNWRLLFLTFIHLHIRRSLTLNQDPLVVLLVAAVLMQHLLDEPGHQPLTLLV